MFSRRFTAQGALTRETRKIRADSQVADPAMPIVPCLLEAVICVEELFWNSIQTANGLDYSSASTNLSKAPKPILRQECTPASSRSDPGSFEERDPGGPAGGQASHTDRPPAFFEAVRFVEEPFWNNKQTANRLECSSVSTIFQMLQSRSLDLPCNSKTSYICVSCSYLMEWFLPRPQYTDSRKNC